MNSMGIERTNLHEIQCNSIEIDPRVQLEFHVVPWYSVDMYKIPWNPMNTLEYYLDLKKLANMLLLLLLLLLLMLLLVRIPYFGDSFGHLSYS